MKIWTFEAWLYDLLTAHDGIAAVHTFAATDVPLLYGLVATSTKGTTVRIHLTRGSGPRDKLKPPPEHYANVARMEGRQRPELTPLPERTADAVEQMLRTAIEQADHPEIVGVRAFAGSQRGLVIAFDCGAEMYLTLTA